MVLVAEGNASPGRLSSSSRVQSSGLESSACCFAVATSSAISRCQGSSALLASRVFLTIANSLALTRKSYCKTLARLCRVNILIFRWGGKISYFSLHNYFPFRLAKARSCKYYLDASLTRGKVFFAVLSRGVGRSADRGSHSRWGVRREKWGSEQKWWKRSRFACLFGTLEHGRRAPAKGHWNFQLFKCAAACLKCQ